MSKSDVGRPQQGTRYLSATDKYQAYCTCGWTGKEQWANANAGEEAVAHDSVHTLALLREREGTL